MERYVVIGGRRVAYTLERKSVKNINLRVRDGHVYVSASRWVPLAVVESFMRSRAEFILSALDRASGRERSYLGGETFYYLGRPVTLKVLCGGMPSVTLSGSELAVTVRAGGDEGCVRRAVERWYRAESETLCAESCARLLPLFDPRRVPQPLIKMRVMRSCWGNCRPRAGTVTFNALLAAVPPECIDYVAAHELTHFLHADHSEAFYSALAQVMPDWKKRRALLKKYAPHVL